ncbi:MAG: sialidase family protein [Planctomycetota bacterium]
MFCPSGGTAVHISRDGGLSWQDAGGTIAGIHAGVVQLTDGRLMGLGRGDVMTRNQIRPWMATNVVGEIDGTYRRMTVSISADMGKTWSYSQAPFPPIGGGQRLVFMRLKEGPLFLASFAGEGNDVYPVMVTDASGTKRRVFGLFVALSYDDAKTWPTIRLITDDGPPREMKGSDGRSKFTLSKSRAEQRGYMSACQARNGLIHLVTSYNHYAFNLKWLETPPPPQDNQAEN